MLVVHMPSRVVQQTGDHPLSAASILVGLLDDVIGQPLFMGAALRHLALRGSMLTKYATGATFRHAKLPPYMINAFPAARVV